MEQLLSFKVTNRTEIFTYHNSRMSFHGNICDPTKLTENISQDFFSDDEVQLKDTKKQNQFSSVNF
jgi:hypothetical protein